MDGSKLTDDDMVLMNKNFTLLEVVERRKYHCAHCGHTFITSKSFTDLRCTKCQFGRWIPGKWKPKTKPVERRLYFSRRK